MKKIISILICIQIALFPAFVYAQNVGGWSMGNPIATGASTVYTGTKNIIINGADYVKKGTAKITPPASGVAKVLARGVAGYALSVAVEQLLGAVDWVLDPANNQIVYQKPVDGSGPYYTNPYVPNTRYSTASSACAASPPSSDYKFAYADGTLCYYTSSSGNTTWFYRVGYFPGTTEIEEKKLPLEVVAQQVISNAESGDIAAQVATTAAAADMVAEAEKDAAKARPIAQQLEASSTTKPADEAAAEKANEATGTQTQNPAKPDTTDLKLEFPIFCNWAPTVCEAAQTVISFPKTLTNWWETGKEKAEGWATSISESWTEAKEWVTGEPDIKQDEADLPIEDKHLDKDPSSFDTDYIVLGSQCPNFEAYTVEVGPISKTLSMDLSPLCDFAAKVRPAIIGMSYLTAAGIVVAAIRET